MEKVNPVAKAELCRALLSLKTEEECGAFLEDICSIRELQDLAQRYAVAILLDSGENYQEISKATGASTATISRVSRCLNYGSSGYRTALDRRKETK